jgi:putative phosphoesterase
MKIGIFSDIHGNNIAFEQCLEVLTKQIKVDRLVFLGDSVGYFTDVNPVLDQLRFHECICITGNHDAMLLGEIKVDEKNDKIYKLKECRSVIKKENLDFIRTFKPSNEEMICNKKVLFVHGSPNNLLNGYIYPDTELTQFGQEYDVIFMGHSHHSFIKKSGRTIFVNVGSVGLPRDCGSHQSFCIFDTEKKEIKIIKNKLKTEKILAKYGPSIDGAVKNILNRDCPKGIDEIRIEL